MRRRSGQCGRGWDPTCGPGSIRIMRSIVICGGGGRAQWLMPLITALWKTRWAGCLNPGVLSQAGQRDKTPSLLEIQRTSSRTLTDSALMVHKSHYILMKPTHRPTGDGCEGIHGSLVGDGERVATLLLTRRALKNCPLLRKSGLAWRLTSIIPALWEAEAEGSLESRSLRSALTIWQDPTSTNNTRKH
ncbi:hypothetical protein AAY473_035055 [Plecturocebus cupreus]